MEEYRVLVVTVLISVVWLSVTFLTINQSEEVGLKMMPILERRRVFVQRFFWALILGVFVLFFVALSWYTIVDIKTTS
jgi:hypothetical protein